MEIQYDMTLQVIVGKPAAPPLGKKAARKEVTKEAPVLEKFFDTAAGESGLASRLLPHKPQRNPTSIAFVYVAVTPCECDAELPPQLMTALIAGMSMCMPLDAARAQTEHGLSDQNGRLDMMQSDNASNAF